jgi:hypothetical protein
MPRAVSLKTDESKRALRALFFLYDTYKNVTLDHIDNHRNTSTELNAVYRNELVPKIREIVDSLEIGPTSSRQVKLEYEPLPFTDLYEIHDVMRQEDQGIDYYIATIGKVQSQSKTLLDVNGASDYGSLDEAQEIIAKINRLKSSHDSSAPLIKLGDKPKIEPRNEKWYVVGPHGSKLLSRKGSKNGELLNILLDGWGASQSYDSLFEKLNNKTRHQFDQSCLKDSMKAINKVVSSAGYRRLKLIDHGTSVTIGYTDRGTN